MTAGDVMWCGVVWCGVMWCGVVWCDVVWYGCLVYTADAADDLFCVGIGRSSGIRRNTLSALDICV